MKGLASKRQLGGLQIGQEDRLERQARVDLSSYWQPQDQCACWSSRVSKEWRRPLKSPSSKQTDMCSTAPCTSYTTSDHDFSESL